MTTLHPLLECVLRGDAAGGWGIYLACQTPSALEQRWAGVCLFRLGRLEEARDLLLRAVGNGCLFARIDLATVYRTLGQVETAQQVLGRLEAATPGSFDKVLWLREMGMIRLTLGERRAALGLLEQAYQTSFSPETTLLRAGVSHALGLLHAEMGQDRKALTYLNQALEGATPSRRVAVTVTHALCQVYLGDFSDAQHLLETAEPLLDEVPMVRATWWYARAILERARGHLREAVQLYAKCIEHARQGDEAETECYAQLERAAIHTVLGERTQARGALARGQALAQTPRLHALAKLREGTFQAQFDALRAEKTLECALESFCSLDMVREQGWTGLHLAALKVAQGQDPTPRLERVADMRHAVGSGGFLALELRGLPELIEHLETLNESDYAHLLLKDWRTSALDSALRLRLHSLGGCRIFLEGVEVKFKQSRSAEIACYFLLHPDVRLDKAIIELFPQGEDRRSRNYLHQVRYDLERQLPGFQIVHHNGLYRVHLKGIQLKWDRDEVRRALVPRDAGAVEKALDLFSGPFLPEVTEEWAFVEREDLTWSVVQVGLQVLEEYYAAGRFIDCLRLAGRLLEFDQDDEGLNDYLVKATERLEGEVAARRLVGRLCTRFEREYGSAPATLNMLRRRLNSLN